MKRLLIGLLLGTAASLAVHKLAGEGRKPHEHCREMMSNHCRSNTDAVSSLSATGSASSATPS